MTRHSLMIVDDEPHVRALLRQCIDWSALGIEIVAEAGNAEDAITAAMQWKPAIMCLDICMPIVNGIELAQTIHDRLPQTKIVVISGHDNFGYAQQCIRLGVTDYLLKPINEEYLRTIMETICRNLDANIATDDARPSPLAIEEKNDTPVLQAGERQGNVAIQEIVAYIHENYMRPELSLQYMAQLFYLNPSYICRAFKQETGGNWVECLTKIRMDHAIHLMKTTDKRSYEIAQEVGFSDAKYFSICFKNFTGQTVNEFRKNNSLGQQSGLLIPGA